jgi:hypothetical protein
MSGRRLDREPFDRLRSWLLLSGILAADGVVASLALHNKPAATLAGLYLLGVVVGGPVLIWRRKI